MQWLTSLEYCTSLKLILSLPCSWRLSDLICNVKWRCFPNFFYQCLSPKTFCSGSMKYLHDSSCWKKSHMVEIDPKLVLSAAGDSVTSCTMSNDVLSHLQLKLMWLSLDYLHLLHCRVNQVQNPHVNRKRYCHNFVKLLDDKFSSMGRWWSYRFNSRPDY